MNIDSEHYSQKRLRDIFDIERVNKSKEYQKDTILIQVSAATNGKPVYLDKSQRIENCSKYAALTIKEPDKYNTKYLYYVIYENMPNIVKRYASGINFQIDALASAKIPIITNRATQNTIADLYDIAVKYEHTEARTVELLKQHKLEMLHRMLC